MTNIGFTNITGTVGYVTNNTVAIPAGSGIVVISSGHPAGITWTWGASDSAGNSSLTNDDNWVSDTSDGLHIRWHSYYVTTQIPIGGLFTITNNQGGGVSMSIDVIAILNQFKSSGQVDTGVTNLTGFATAATTGVSPAQSGTSDTSIAAWIASTATVASSAVSSGYTMISTNAWATPVNTTWIAYKTGLTSGTTTATNTLASAQSYCAGLTLYKNQ